VFFFTPDAELLRSYTPDFRLSFGREYEGPWCLTDLAIGTSGGKPVVWLAYKHHTWWPSAVIELDASGAGRVRFQQSGWITSLAYWETPSGRILAAGGVNNEYGMASLAVLGVDDGPASSPQTAHEFTCRGCPDGRPRQYFLFPKREQSRTSGAPYFFVSTLQPIGERLKAVTDEPLGSTYFISPDFGIGETALSDQWRAAHDRVAEQAGLDHRLHECPEFHKPWTIRAWTEATGWRDLAVPPPALQGDPGSW
jgi:hypothetical protein